jgi:hypothetical protein
MIECVVGGGCQTIADWVGNAMADPPAGMLPFARESREGIDPVKEQHPVGEPGVPEPRLAPGAPNRGPVSDPRTRPADERVGDPQNPSERYSEFAATKVPREETDLGRAVEEQRRIDIERLKWREAISGNYAALRLPNGQIVVRRSDTEGHAELKLREEFGPLDGLDLYTEREPCRNQCGPLTKNSNVTYSWDWNHPTGRGPEEEALRKGTTKEIVEANRKLLNSQKAKKSQ